MRKRGVCPKCQHNRILLIQEVADTGEVAGQQLRPLHVAIAREGDGWIGARLVAAGQLTAAVCKACGFTELYTRFPDSIPVDGARVREIVGPEPAAPEPAESPYL